MAIRRRVPSGAGTSTLCPATTPGGIRTCMYVAGPNTGVAYVCGRLGGAEGARTVTRVCHQSRARLFAKDVTCCSSRQSINNMGTKQGNESQWRSISNKRRTVGKNKRKYRERERKTVAKTKYYSGAITYRLGRQWWSKWFNRGIRGSIRSCSGRCSRNCPCNCTNGLLLGNGPRGCPRYHPARWCITSAVTSTTTASPRAIKTCCRPVPLRLGGLHVRRRVRVGCAPWIAITLSWWRYWQIIVIVGLRIPAKNVVPNGCYSN